MTSKDGIFWLAKFSQVQDNSSCSHCHLNCQHLSPSPLQGIGEQDSPPDLPHLHPCVLDFRLDLANRWEPHPRWQCLKLYFSCVRILLWLLCLAVLDFIHGFFIRKYISISFRCNCVQSNLQHSVLDVCNAHFLVMRYLYCFDHLAKWIGYHSRHNPCWLYAIVIIHCLIRDIIHKYSIISVGSQHKC